MAVDNFVTKGLEIKQKIENLQKEVIETKEKFKEMCICTNIVPPLFGKKRKAIKIILNAIEEKYQSRFYALRNELVMIHEQCPFYGECSSGYVSPYTFFK